jgi:hypothetical protein
LKRPETRTFRLGRAGLLTVYGAAALFGALLFAWSNPWDSRAEPIGWAAFLLGALAGVALTFLGDHLLIWRPLDQAMAFDRDPVSVRRPVPYPKFGFQLIHAVLRAIEDYQIQREAYNRLIEAYRSLSLAERGPLASSLQRLSAVAHQSGLAKRAICYLIDLSKGQVQPQSQDAAQIDHETRALLFERLSESTFEFADRGLLWVHCPLPDTDDHFVSLAIEPRPLWNRMPKIYRRFFSTQATLLAESWRASALPSTKSRDLGDSDEDDGLARPEAPRSRAIPSTDYDGAKFFAASKGSWIADPGELSPYLGFARRSGTKGSADFLWTLRSKERQLDLVVLGSAVGQSGRLSEAAAHLTGLLAATWSTERLEATLGAASNHSAPLEQPQSALSQPPHPHHFLSQALHDSETEQRVSQTFLDLAQTLHRHLRHVFAGKVATQVVMVVFNYEQGAGYFARFGGPAPYLSSPDERKPLQLASTQARTNLLGLNEEPHSQTTAFQSVPGQVVLLLTEATLNVRDDRGRTFERELARGRLGAIDPEARLTGPSALGNAVLDEVESHNGRSALVDGAFVVCLAARGTFDGTKVTH